MNFSDSIKSIFSTTLDEFAADPRNYALDPGKDFSRNRKLGFKDLMMLLFTMEGDCINEEIYHYFGRTTNAPSKAAFYKQRNKIKPDAMRSFMSLVNHKLISLKS